MDCECGSIQDFLFYSPQRSICELLTSTEGHGTEAPFIKMTPQKIVNSSKMSKYFPLWKKDIQQN